MARASRANLAEPGRCGQQRARYSRALGPLHASIVADARRPTSRALFERSEDRFARRKRGKTNPDSDILSIVLIAVDFVFMFCSYVVPQGASHGQSYQRNPSSHQNIARQHA